MGTMYPLYSILLMAEGQTRSISNFVVYAVDSYLTEDAVVSHIPPIEG